MLGSAPDSAKQNSAGGAIEVGLLAVWAHLDASIASLLKLDFAVPNEAAPHERRLHEAARLLGEIRASVRAGKLEAGPANARAEELLRGVRTRANQAQALLEAGTALCRGWLLAAPPAAPDYTPEGVWAEVYEPSRLRYEA